MPEIRDNCSVCGLSEDQIELSPCFKFTKLPELPGDQEDLEKGKKSTSPAHTSSGIVYVVRNKDDSWECPRCCRHRVASLDGCTWCGMSADRLELSPRVNGEKEEKSGAMLPTLTRYFVSRREDNSWICPLCKQHNSSLMLSCGKCVLNSSQLRLGPLRPKEYAGHKTSTNSSTNSGSEGDEVRIDMPDEGEKKYGGEGKEEKKEEKKYTFSGSGLLPPPLPNGYPCIKTTNDPHKVAKIHKVMWEMINPEIAHTRTLKEMQTFFEFIADNGVMAYEKFQGSFRDAIWRKLKECETTYEYDREAIFFISAVRKRIFG